MRRRAGRGASARLEKDTLGTLSVPAGVYYGIQTRRAMLNFPISGRRLPVGFILAYAHIKLACASANEALGLLDRRRSAAIRRAASEILARRHLDQFVVDVYQAGAGTSQNMNLNEVIANRAIEILGGRLGDYSVIHPNDHVNMSQSTNDTFPSAMRLALQLALPGLRRSLDECAAGFRSLARRHRKTVKSARTHLQDAVPIMLGQEFGAYASILERAALRLDEAARPLRRLNLGATAAGTGLNAPSRFAPLVVRKLSSQTGLPLRTATDRVEIAMSCADFAHLSAALRNLALELGKIANDLRLLASGPMTGLAEIELPAVQPGSSIMPGKVNPVMCEMLNMVCFRVIGCDQTVASASGAGQLELNVMMPVIADSLLEAVALLQAGVAAFTRRCVPGIRADAARCRFYFEKSPAIVTALTPVIGYERAAELAKASLRTGTSIVDSVLQQKLVEPEALRRALDPEHLTRPGIVAIAGARGVRSSRSRVSGNAQRRRG